MSHNYILSLFAHLVEEGILGVDVCLGILAHLVQSHLHIQLTRGDARVGRLVHRDADEKILRRTGKTFLFQLVHDAAKKIQ